MNQDLQEFIFLLVRYINIDTLTHYMKYINIDYAIIFLVALLLVIALRWNKLKTKTQMLLALIFVSLGTLSVSFFAIKRVVIEDIRPQINLTLTEKSQSLAQGFQFSVSKIKNDTFQVLSSFLSGNDKLSKASKLALDQSEIKAIYIYSVENATEEMEYLGGIRGEMGREYGVSLPSELTLDHDLNNIVVSSAKGEEFFYSSVKTGNFFVSNVYEYADKKIVSFTEFSSSFLRKIMLKGDNFINLIFYKNKLVLSNTDLIFDIEILNGECVNGVCKDSNQFEKYQVRELSVFDKDYIYTFQRNSNYAIATILDRQFFNIVATLEKGVVTIFIAVIILTYLLSNLIAGVSTRRIELVQRLFEGFIERGEDFDFSRFENVDDQFKNFILRVKMLFEVRLQKEGLEHEIKNTESVQRKLFPKLYFNNNFVRFEGTIINPEDCSGDGIFYRDLGDRLVVIMNDIAGHGLSSAFPISSIPMALNAYIRFNKDKDFDPKDFVEFFDEESNIIKTSLFVGVYYYKKDKTNGLHRFDYASAGHDGQTYLLREDGNVEDLNEEVTKRIGVKLSVANEYKTHTTYLDEGDKVFACTDGTNKHVKSPRKFMRLLRGVEGHSGTESLKDYIMRDLKDVIDDDVTFFFLGPNEMIEGKKDYFLLDTQNALASFKEGIAYLRNDQRTKLYSPGRAKEIERYSNIFENEFDKEKLSQIDIKISKESRDLYRDQLGANLNIPEGVLSHLRFIAGEMISNAIFHTNNNGNYFVDILDKSFINEEGKKVVERWVVYKDDCGDCERDVLLRKMEQALRGAVNKDMTKGAGIGTIMSLNRSDAFICQVNRGHYTKMAYRIPKRINEDDLVVLISDAKGEF